MFITLIHTSLDVHCQGRLGRHLIIDITHVLQGRRPRPRPSQATATGQPHGQSSSGGCFLGLGNGIITISYRVESIITHLYRVPKP